ncbi:MAG: hypothetical protein AB7F86_17440 [Bdellovibrionales bacterium]
MSQSNMDPFDEFEFKPLTEGLGFHKKTVSLKDGLKSTGVVEEELQGIPSQMPKSFLDEAPMAPLKKHTFEDVLSALEKSPLSKSQPDLKVTEPLPREKDRAMDIEVPRAPIQSPFPQPDAFKAPVIKKTPPLPEMGKVGTRRGSADSPMGGWMPATISFESAILDFIIVTGLSLIFMVALLMVTKVDLNIVLKNLNADVMTQVSLVVLFIAVMQMYVVIARAFFGRTVGEWTFDLQIGLAEDQRKDTYPLRVGLRSLVVTATGLIFLPLISAIIGRDIAGRVSGVSLYRQRG